MDSEERNNKLYSIMRYFDYEIRKQLVDGGVPEEAVNITLRKESVGWKIYFYLDEEKISDEVLEEW